MDAPYYLHDIVVLLLAAVVMVPIFQRLGIPAVLGYLAAGAMLSPYTPGPVIEVEGARPLAEFGVVFLLFSIGLDLPLTRLKAMRRYIFGLGLPQVLMSALALGGIAMLCGFPPSLALVIGATLGFSSTATVLTLLVERGEAVGTHGRIAIAVLIFQDLAVVPVLALLPLLGGGTGDILSSLGLAAIKAVAAIGIILLLGRLAIRPLYRFVSQTRNAEVFSATNLLLVLVVGGGTAAAGMSMALGAFLAGLLLSDSAYRHQVAADIEPFRGLLLGLFFMTVGMSIDLPFVKNHLFSILALTLILVVVKSVILAGLCWLLNIKGGNAGRIGFAVGTRWRVRFCRIH